MIELLLSLKFPAFISKHDVYKFESGRRWSGMKRFQILSCWTGRLAGFCRGGCRSQWERHSASRSATWTFTMAAVRIRAFTVRCRSSLLQHTASPLGSLAESLL